MTDLYKTISEKTKDTIFRVLTTLVSTILYGSILPTIMYVIYMKENMIFSYDFFMNGVFAISVFSSFSMLMVLIFLILLTSSIFMAFYLFIHYKCYKNSKKLLICKYHTLEEEAEIKKYWNVTAKISWGIFILLFLMNVYFTFLMLSNNVNVINEVIFLIVVCALLTFHYAVVIFIKPIYSIFTLIGTFFIIIGFMFGFQKTTSELVNFGLKVFNTGQKEVVVKDMKNNILQEGTMLLLSPDNIFIKIKDSTGHTKTAIIKRENIIIDIKN